MSKIPENTAIKRATIPSIMAMKAKQPIVCLTAYSARQAELLDPYVDILLVGDSLGMVLYGLESTLSVTLDMMIRHGRAVASHSKRALVVVDMPFGSYQASPEQAFTHAARIMAESGAGAVKLEGGLEMCDTISFLVKRGIPVMGHVGLKPQHVHVIGGYKYQGRTASEQDIILNEAKAIAEAGAFSIVIEGTAEPLAATISKTLIIPTIGIGASAACDGQVLVTDDMIGMFEHTARFVQQFGAVRDEISTAVERYADAVRHRHFPSSAHTYPADAKKS